MRKLGFGLSFFEFGQLSKRYLPRLIYVSDRYQHILLVVIKVSRTWYTSMKRRNASPVLLKISCLVMTNKLDNLAPTAWFINAATWTGTVLE